MHENLHKNMNETCFIHTFIQTSISFYDGLLKQQISILQPYTINFLNGNLLLM